jgi:hypothetical protein
MKVRAVRISLGVAILGLLLVCSCVIPISLDKDIDGRVYLSDGSYAVGGDGEPIILIDNPEADNPTYEELLLFIGIDDTDQKDYIPLSYVCGDFAETLHNNAEEFGYKTAYVTVTFEEDVEMHALNAFETVDKGLVYVDCTGRNIFTPHYFGEPVIDSCDKIAYIEVGEVYGCISADKATSPDYSFYETYSAKWDAYNERLESYNEEVESYNEALGGRTSLEEPEYSEFLRWSEELEQEKAELDALKEELGDCHWEPLGTVSSFEIIWEGR